MRLIRALAIAVLLAPAACGGGDSDDLLDRARAEAKKVAPDAALVQIEFSNFGFATGRGGVPDMTKAGPPKNALFNFYSPATGKGFRVVADINREPPPAEIAKVMRERGYKDMRVEHAEVPYTPYTLPLPDEIGDMSRAVEAARDTIDKDCAGGDPRMSTCRLQQSAELHMHWSGPKDEGGTPVWTVTFGQNPKTYADVRRTVEDRSYDLYAAGDAQTGDYNDRATKPLRQADLRVGHGFDALWPKVVAEVRKQDPLYAPYAVSLITYLRSVRAAGGKAVVSEAHIQFARLTPSLIWDEVEAHVGWRDDSDDDAVLFFSPPRRHSDPNEARPATLKADELPEAEPALRALLKNFPDKYAEVTSTWSKGCDDVLTFVPGLKMWRCGVYVETKRLSDLVFLWLSRQGNPYWQSGRAPLATEYRAVAAGTPKGGWAWWTRVKHPERWEYFLIDAKSGRPDKGFCTNPNTGLNTIQQLPCKS